MAVRKEKRAPRRYIVATGLSRRLIEADTPDEALTKFKYETPRRAVLRTFDDEFDVHEATEDEAAEFVRHSRSLKPGDGQLALDVGAM